MIEDKRPGKLAFGVPALTKLLVDEGTHGRDGLTFVPFLVRILAGREGVSEAIAYDAVLLAAQARTIELEPDPNPFGLTSADKRLCIPGPEGSVLAWARLP